MQIHESIAETRHVKVTIWKVNGDKRKNTVDVKVLVIPKGKGETFKWELSAKSWSKVIESLADGGVMTTKHWIARMKWAETLAVSRLMKTTINTEPKLPVSLADVWLMWK